MTVGHQPPPVSEIHRNGYFYHFPSGTEEMDSLQPLLHLPAVPHRPILWMYSGLPGMEKTRAKTIQSQDAGVPETFKGTVASPWLPRGAQSCASRPSQGLAPASAQGLVSGSPLSMALFGQHKHNVYRGPGAFLLVNIWLAHPGGPRPLPHISNHPVLRR